MLPDNDIGVWKWVTGSFCAVVIWIGRSTWKASSTITTMKNDLSQLKASVNDQEARCKQMQGDLASNVSSSLKNVFEAMLSETVLTHTKELAEMNKNLALLAQRNDSLGEQVSKLADKVDKIYVNGSVDSGLLRRVTDYQTGGK